MQDLLGLGFGGNKQQRRNPFEPIDIYELTTLKNLVYYSESRMDKAFKIIKALMDEKMIKEDLTVKEFMNICEAISKVI